MIEFLIQNLWLLVFFPVLCLLMGYVGGKALVKIFTKKKLNPTPRPNRAPFDSDTFRR